MRSGPLHLFSPFLLLLLLSPSFFLPLEGCNHEDPLHPTELISMEQNYGNPSQRQSQARANIRITTHFGNLFPLMGIQTYLTTFKDILVPKAVAFFQQRLKVTPVKGPLFFTPTCERRSDNTCSTAPEVISCGGTKLPLAYHSSVTYCPTEPGAPDCNTTAAGTGVPDTDFLLVINAVFGSECRGQSLGFAGTCSTDQNDRPILGYYTFCLRTFTEIPNFQSFSPSVLLQLETVVVHQITHSLVFSLSLFNLFRDENNVPRVPRDSAGKPISSSALFGKVLSDNTERGHTVYKVITPNVLSVASSLLDCPTLNGAELEDQGINHWEERIFYGEFMAGNLPSRRATFSTLTAALFKDSGWYDVDYSQWQTNLYGAKAGCDFANQLCLQGDKSNPTPSHPHFCKPIGTDPTSGCSSDRLSVAFCSLTNYATTIPDHFSYFSDSRGGPVMSDYCPRMTSDHHLPSYNRDCLRRDNFNSSTPTLEVIGPSSRCFTSTFMQTGTAVPKVETGRCYETKCIRNENKVATGIQILVAGLFPVNCTKGGEVVSVSNELFSGTLTCPQIWQICPDGGDCPNGCSGFGTCEKGVCVCSPGFSGADCSVAPSAGKKRMGEERNVEEIFAEIRSSKRATSSSPGELFVGAFNEVLGQEGYNFNISSPFCVQLGTQFLQNFPLKLSEDTTYPSIYNQILKGISKFLQDGDKANPSCFPSSSVFSKGFTSSSFDSTPFEPHLKKIYRSSIKQDYEALGEAVGDITIEADVIRVFVVTKSVDLRSTLAQSGSKTLPESWTCDPASFGSGDGCDCGCGAADPDCDSQSVVAGCYDGSAPKCVNGNCVYGKIPGGWTCDELSYGTFDGCDCGCGAYDPDCDVQPKDLDGCPDGDASCSPTGTCIYQLKVPKEWECTPSSYHDSDFCDCGCGAWDPDCDDPSLPNTCLCPSMKCSPATINGVKQGVCTGKCAGGVFALESSPPPTPSTPSPSTPSPSTPSPSTPSPSTPSPSTPSPSTPPPTTPPPTTPSPTPCQCPPPSPSACSKSVINVNFKNMLGQKVL